MGRRAALWLVLPLLGLVLACALAPTAQAYTYVLRPSTTLSTGSWSASPGGTFDSVLDDNVLSPVAPATGGDYVSANANGPSTFELGLADVALRAGESITSLRSWTYADSGDARTLDVELRAGATTLGADGWTVSLPAQWRSILYTGSVTQSELNDLRHRVTLQGVGASSPTHVYAAYAEAHTDMAAPAPTITAGPGVAGQGTSPSWSFTSTLAAAFECRLEKDGSVVSAWAACTSAKSYAIGGTGDGTYTFSVRGLDDVGAAGPSASATYVLDRVAPNPPTITSAPPSPTKNPLLAWSFSGEGGALHSCRLTRGATVVSDWALCTSPFSHNLGATPTDGAYTFEVMSTDMAGNAGTAATSTITFDSTPPAAPAITAAPPATGNSSAPSWSFTHEAGASPMCRLERGASVVSDWSACSSPKTWALGGVDETYTFRVRADDAAGNEGAITTRTYVLDDEPPAAPVITGGPTGETNAQTPQWTFTTEASTTTECRIERAGTTVSDWAACSSPHTHNLTGQPDGSYTFLVRANDAAGNQGLAATRTFTRDRTAPAAPVITGGPPASSADPAPSFSFTHEGGTTAECSITKGAAVISAFAPCPSPHGYDLTSSGDGAYVFRVRAVDPAGNIGPEATRNYTLDRVEPVAPTITGRPAAVTNDTTPTWTFTASFDVIKYRCRIERGATVVSDYAVCTSPHTYTLAIDGTYTFKVRGSDDAANESTETSDTFTLDTSPPSPPTITGGPTGTSQNATPTFTWTAEVGATTECAVDRNGATLHAWSACSSPRSYDFTLPGDGVYTFRVRATDVAGNPGNEATRTYTLDKTPPAPPTITAGPPPDSNDHSPVYSFTAEPGATLSCRLDNGTTPISDWTACSTPTGYDLSPPTPDGSYTFRVRATDAAGNTSVEATRAYTLDRVPPPAPTLTADPGADTNSNTPTWAFTAAGGTTTACRLERGATVVSDWAACSSPRAYDLTAQPQGTYTFRVRATDAAGNTGAETAHSTTLDRTPPPAPTIAGGPVADTADPTPAFSFSAESGATPSCRLERGATVVSDWAVCASPRSYDLSAQSDGAYTFRVRATDAAGNTGPEATRSFTLDRQAPNQPAITGRPAASTNDDTPTWTWTGESGSWHYCRITQGAAVVVDWAVCASPRTFDMSGQADGTYTFRVRASDAAGNISTEANDTFALDRVAPAAPTITTGPTGDSPNAAPSYSFTAEAGAALSCRIERPGTVVSDWSACVSPRAYDLALQPDASYTFRVRATDAAGNTGAETTRTYTLDRAAPAAPVFVSAPSGFSQDATPTYDWTAEVGSASTCRMERGATVVSDWAACSTPHTPTLTAQPDGVYTFRVRATDAAGNTGTDASRTYTLDRTAPAAPAITAGPATDSTDDSPTYAFTAEPGAAVECELRKGASVLSGFSACASPRTYDVSNDGDGTYTFTVRATDAAGNQSADAVRTYTLDRTTPASPVLDARPGDDGNGRSPQWAFSTPEANRTFECRLVRGATVLFDWGACVSPRQYDLSLQPDGAYTFAVRAVNLAGTRSTPTTDVYRLDTAAPAAPAVSGGPAPDSVDATPTWTITTEPGATLECLLEHDGTVMHGWSACSSPQGYTVAADGTYTFRTRATDAAGNEGAVASVSYNLDRTEPTAPVLGTTPPAAGNDATPTWSFTGEPGRTFQCRLSRDGAPLGAWAACTSPYSPDLSAADGDYTLEVRAVSAAGTPGAVTTDQYVLDRGTPAAPVITAGPPADSADATPTWSFTGESGAAFECSVHRGTTVVVAFTACTSPETSNLAGHPDGTYTFLVRQTDAAGNQSPDASRSYTLDRTVPAAPSITTRPASPSPDKTPTWELSGTSGLTLECRVTRGGVQVSDWAACASPRTYDLSAEPDGTYRLHARQYNPAGTRGPEVTDDYVLDASAPAAPDITATPGATGNGSEPSWSFAAEAGANVECRLQRDGVDVRPWAACASPRTFGLVGEPDGDYTFSVRATDDAGNTGAASTSTHRLDRVPPAPPGIAASPGPLGSDRRPSWAFTAEAGAVFECTLAGAGGAIDEWAVCSSPRGYDLGGQPDGAFAFGVRARDAAGNTSPATSSPYTLDTTPGAVAIEGGPGPLGRDRNPAWRFRGEEGARFECRLALRGVPVADWVPCLSPHGFDLGGRPDGVFAFSLRALDQAGNVGPAGEASYQLDTTPPASPEIERRPESPASDRTPTWRFSGERDATFTCRVEREPARTVLGWTLCSSPFTADLAREDDGEYRFHVRATDVAGNTGEAATSGYELEPPRKEEEDAGSGDEKGATDEVPREEDEPGPLTATPRPPKRKAAPKAKSDTEPRVPPQPDPRRRAEPRTPVVGEPAPAEQEKEEGGNFATRAVSDAVSAITRNPDKSVFPLSLLLLVLGFLAIQNRLDRNDPKLALAPTFADPDLEFRPSPGDDE